MYDLWLATESNNARKYQNIAVKPSNRFCEAIVYSVVSIIVMPNNKIKSISHRKLFGEAICTFVKCIKKSLLLYKQKNDNNT